MKLADIKIILVEPAGALNVGSVARVMKNFGLQQLVLVNPQCDRASHEAQKMAVHAQDVLETAMVVSTIPDALLGCTKVVATTGISHDWQAPLETPQQIFPWLLQPNPTHQTGAIIFGREDRGLTNQELNYAQRFLQISSHPEYPSLNLAMAVGVCCYELSKEKANQEQACQEKAPSPESPNTELTNTDLMPWEVGEFYYQQLESLLLNIGYLYPHTAASRMEKLRQMYNRTQLTNQEVAMLLGIIRQIQWAIGNKNNRQDL